MAHCYYVIWRKFMANIYDLLELTDVLIYFVKRTHAKRYTFRKAGYLERVDFNHKPLENKQEAPRERKPPPRLIWGAWISLIRHKTV